MQAKVKSIRKIFYNPLSYITSIIVILTISFTPTAFAESNEELAKKLSNPIASLISLPLQLNYDSDFGANDNGDRYLLNIQPVVPITLNDDWNIISRTILPVISQSDIFGSTSQTGLGDVLQSLFISPKLPTQNGWVWGAGPVFLLPTATDDLLGAEKWGLGPTAVALKQTGPWTFGALTNHIWSVAGDNERDDISSTFLQPFMSYTTKTAMTFSFNTESTYNWKSSKWSVPVNANITQVMKWGEQLISIGGGLRYWLDSPDSGAEGLGLRLQLTFLFPKK